MNNKLAKRKERKFNLSTYQDVLKTLQAIEEDECKFRQQRFWICTFSIFVSIIGLITYAFIQQRFDVFISGDTVKVLLIPLFSYLFMSFQEDLISERKSELYESILHRFEPVESRTEPKMYPTKPIDFTKVKEVIEELLKSKL